MLYILIMLYVTYNFTVMWPAFLHLLNEIFIQSVDQSYNLQMIISVVTLKARSHWWNPLDCFRDFANYPCPSESLRKRNQAIEYVNEKNEVTRNPPLNLLFTEEPILDSSCWRGSLANPIKLKRKLRIMTDLSVVFTSHNYAKPKVRAIIML